MMRNNNAGLTPQYQWKIFCYKTPVTRLCLGTYILRIKITGESNENATNEDKGATDEKGGFHSCGKKQVPREGGKNAFLKECVTYKDRCQVKLRR